jgi:hypothetical protein
MWQLRSESAAGMERFVDARVMRLPQSGRLAFIFSACSIPMFRSRCCDATNRQLKMIGEARRWYEVFWNKSRYLAISERLGEYQCRKKTI